MSIRQFLLINILSKKLNSSFIVRNGEKIKFMGTLKLNKKIKTNKISKRRPILHISHCDNYISKKGIQTIMDRGFSVNNAIILTTIIILCCQLAFSATILGTVYNLDLDRAKAVVEVNSVPEQRIIAVNGTYSFELPKGKYIITAKLFNQEEYSTQENITVLDDNGHYIFDLFYFTRCLTMLKTLI